MIAVGVVGFGHWGPNYTRILAADSETTLAFVCDASADRCRRRGESSPRGTGRDDTRRCLALAEADAVIVATPAETHAPMVRAALDAGLHVLAEKPLGMDAAEVEDLLDASGEADRTLMADHTYVFSEPVARLHDLVASGIMGGPFAYRSLRTNPHHVAGPVGVLRDLAVHDLAILEVLHSTPPTAVAATRPESAGGVDLVELRLSYDDGSSAEVSVGWGTAERTRRVTLESRRATVVYDDLLRGREVEVLRVDDTLEPVDGWHEPLGRSSDTEPLRGAIRHFVQSIGHRTEPVTSGRSALRIARVLDAGRASLAIGGDDVELGELEALG